MANVKQEVAAMDSSAAAETLRTLSCIFCRAVIAMINGTTARYKQHLSEFISLRDRD